jgi:membrane protein implicated in regulation of membrane protease activity
MELNIGWVMIIIGLVLLVVEALQPGFFVAVPGTALIVLGTVTLLFPGFAQEHAPAIIVVTVLISGIITIAFYRKRVHRQKSDRSSEG